MTKAALLLSAVSAALGLATNARAEPLLSGGFEVTYQSWDDGLESGRQLAAPLTLSASWEAFSLGVRTAYVSTEVDSPFALASGEFDTFTDTTITARWAAFARDGWRVDVNGDVNAPTGAGELRGLDKNTLTEGLRANYDHFGEGLNLGLGVVVTRTLSEHVQVGAGVSYISRGDYRPDLDAGSTLDPADQIAASFSGVYARGPLTLAMSARLIREEETKVDAQPVIDRGDIVDFMISGAFAAEQFSIDAAATYVTQDNAVVFDPDTHVGAEEPNNSTGDRLAASLGLTLRRPWSPRLSAQYVDIERNEYDENSLQFLPARSRVGVAIELRIPVGQAEITPRLGAGELTDKGFLGFADIETDLFEASLGYRRRF